MIFIISILSVCIVSDDVITPAGQKISEDEINEYNFNYWKYEAAVIYVMEPRSLVNLSWLPEMGSPWLPGMGSRGFLQNDQIIWSTNLEKSKTIFECHISKCILKTWGFFECNIDNCSVTDDNDEDVTVYEKIWIKDMCLQIAPLKSGSHDVCVNPPKAPSCKNSEFDGSIMRNVLTVGKSFKTNCKFQIYNCQIRKFLLNLANDTSVRCKFKLMKEESTSNCEKDMIEQKNDTLLGFQSVSHDGEAATYISYKLEGLKGAGYLIAQAGKSWGSGGIQRTQYDVCSQKKCDFNCIKTNTCVFACCNHSKFRELKGNQICERLGYIDHMNSEYFSKSIGIATQLQNVTLVIQKLNVIGVLASPAAWYAAGFIFAAIDWILSHYFNEKFHEWVADFPLNDWEYTKYLQNGIVISGEDTGGKICKIFFGFVFVFIPSLIQKIGACIGASILSSQNWAHDLWKLLGDKAEKMWEKIYSGLKGAFEKLYEFISSQAKSAAETILKWLEKPSGALGGIIWQIQNQLGSVPASCLSWVVKKKLMDVIIKCEICSEQYEANGENVQWDKLINTLATDFNMGSSIQNDILMAPASCIIPDKVNSGFYSALDEKQKQEERSRRRRGL